MQPKLITIVPTRSRPFHVKRVVDAWIETGAFNHGAELCFVLDADDPAYDAYCEQLTFAASSIPNERRVMTWMSQGQWRPLVPKLNIAADYLRVTQEPFALGFAGDDHVPRSYGWADRVLRELLSDGVGIVYGDDGYQGENLATEWSMRTSIVKALDGKMVPAPVEHLYCDNAIMELGREAGILRYLPDVKIEHMHPVAGKAEGDAQYERVNSRDQYRNDRPAYRRWRRDDLAGVAATVRALFEGERQHD